MDIPKNIKDELWEYCRLNDITDIDSFMLNCLKQGFSIEKYGTTPFKINQKEPEIVEKEIIKEIEVIKEVPVEVIREVEVIKEVDKIVEVIKEVSVEVIKEVQVEKEVYITDDGVVNKLQSDLGKLNDKIVFENKEYDKLMGMFEKSQLQKAEIREQLDTVTKELVEEKEIPKLIKVEKPSESEEISKLKSVVTNLEIELELEKNRNFVPEKRKVTQSEKPDRSRLGNIINWAPKKDGEIDDLYND